MFRQDDWIAMVNEPVIEAIVEFYSTAQNILRHLPQDQREDPRGRTEAEGQSLKLIGLRGRHRKT